MGKESKRQVRKVLREVMNDPAATPRDRLMASARYERLKYKPRGRHVKKAVEEQRQEANPEPEQSTQPPAAQPERTLESLLRPERSSSVEDDKRLSAFVYKINSMPFDEKQRYLSSPEGKAERRAAYAPLGFVPSFCE